MQPLLLHYGDRVNCFYGRLCFLDASEIGNIFSIGTFSFESPVIIGNDQVNGQEVVFLSNSKWQEESKSEIRISVLSLLSIYQIDFLDQDENLKRVIAVINKQDKRNIEISTTFLLDQDGEGSIEYLDSYVINYKKIIQVLGIKYKVPWYVE